MTTESTLTGLTTEYELIVIFKPEITEEALKGITDNLTQFITANGGAVSATEQWGKRKLAYKIDQFLEGVYILFKLQLKPSFGKELVNKLRISDEVLRYILVKASNKQGK